MVDDGMTGREIAKHLNRPHTTVAAWIRDLKNGSYDDSAVLRPIAPAAPPPQQPPPPPPPAPSVDFDADPAGTRKLLLSKLGTILNDVTTDPKDLLQTVKLIASYTGADQPESSDEAGNFGLDEGRRLRQMRRLLALRLGEWVRAQNDHRLEELFRPVATLAPGADVRKCAQYLLDTYGDTLWDSLGARPRPNYHDTTVTDLVPHEARACTRAS